MKCTKCDQETEEKAFATFRDRNGILRRRGICKICRGQYALDNFEKLQEWRKNYNAANRTKRALGRSAIRAKTKAYIDSVKAAPCTDCRQSFPPVCMDFDHTGSSKIKSIARMYSSGYNLRLIQEEIAKCELVCANCHRIRTANRRENLAGPIDGRFLTG